MVFIGFWGFFFLLVWVFWGASFGLDFLGVFFSLLGVFVCLGLVFVVLAVCHLWKPKTGVSRRHLNKERVSVSTQMFTYAKM